MVTVAGLASGPGPHQRQPSAMPAIKPRTAAIKSSRRNMWLVDCLHDERGIGSAKAEAVVERRLDLALLGVMRHEIDALGSLVGVVEVERRRDDLVADGEDAEDRLHRSGAAEQ